MQIARFTGFNNLHTWVTYFGGNEDDQIKSITLDGLDNLYITGHTSSLPTSSTNYCLVPPTGEFPLCNLCSSSAYFQTTLKGNTDGFIAKFEQILSYEFKWGTYFGGNGDDFCHNIIDVPITLLSFNIYVVGYTTDPADFPVLAGGTEYTQPFGGGNNDAFIARFRDCIQDWAAFYGSGGDEGGFDNQDIDITADADKNIYICGVTTGADFPHKFLAGAYDQPAHSGPSGTKEGYIAAFNPANEQFWSSYYGGGNAVTTEADDHLSAIGAYLNDKLFVTGWSHSIMNFPFVDPGEGIYFQNTITAGDRNGIIARFIPVIVTGTTNEISFSSKPFIYPNPAEGTVNVKIEAEKSVAGELVLYNMFGERVKAVSLNIQQGITNYKLDVSDFASGIYPISVRAGKALLSGRLVRY